MSDPLPWVIDDQKVQDNFDAVQRTAGDRIAQNPGFTTGDVKMGAYTTPDDGWLLCDGSAVSRSAYSRLFAKIGTTYGTGDGSTTFNVPDAQGRSPAGAGTGDATGATLHTLGDKVGEQTHVLTTSEMPAHDHGGATGAPSGAPSAGRFGDWTGAGAQNGWAIDSVTGGSNAYETHTHSISSQGGGAAHENRGPRIVFNFFIKT